MVYDRSVSSVPDGVVVLIVNYYHCLKLSEWLTYFVWSLLVVVRVVSIWISNLNPAPVDM